MTTDHLSAGATFSDCHDRGSTPLTLSTSVPEHLQRIQSATLSSVLPVIFGVSLFVEFIYLSLELKV